MARLLAPAGGLLDYGALREALASGRVAGLGLDVQEEEPVDPQHWLAQHPAVYLTPHIAGVTELSCEWPQPGCLTAGPPRPARGRRGGLQPLLLACTSLRPQRLHLPLAFLHAQLLQARASSAILATSPIRADRNMARVVADAAVRVRHGWAPKRLLNEPAHPRALDWLT